MIDKMVVYVKSHSAPTEKKLINLLKERKAGINETFNSDPKYTSRLDVVNGYEVFFADFVLDGLRIYRFIVVNQKQDQVQGFVQYGLRRRIKG